MGWGGGETGNDIFKILEAPDKKNFVGKISLNVLIEKLKASDISQRNQSNCGPYRRPQVFRRGISLIVVLTETKASSIS